jgi:hypothetical protein
VEVERVDDEVDTDEAVDPLPGLEDELEEGKGVDFVDSFLRVVVMVVAEVDPVLLAAGITYQLSVTNPSTRISSPLVNKPVHQ